MKSTLPLHNLLRLPASCRAAMLPPLRPSTRTFTLLAPPPSYVRALSVPRILTPSFWGQMIPKPFKGRSDKPKSREWNPATPYIILGLLVGSQAIQILWLKQERGHTLRKAETKIGLLREVIERVQNGEKVNVEEILGTGNAASEKEWAEVMKEIENEEVLFQGKKKRKAKSEAAIRQVPEEELKEEVVESPKEDGHVKVESVGGVKFY